MQRPAIDIRNILKRYGKIQALDNVTFQIPTGEIFGLLGPNGAGKSTLINILCGLVKPDAGSVTIAGHDAKREHQVAAEDFGVLLESFGFYPTYTARDTLTILQRYRGYRDQDEVDTLLDKVGLSERADSRVQSYSQGMHKRLGIATALLGDPKIIILDEPTAGLDPGGMQAIRTLLTDLHAEGTTIVISSHLLGEIERLCTRIALLKSGEIISEGVLKDILTQDGDITSLEDYFLKQTGDYNAHE
ncbi:MAG: putative ABC transporter ATP-binding protein YadG [Candidatus Marinimicrobia bacterium]|nr:putative ABC transporter ATP-binding protein YadG [Candidatus Neomarinimicrobiota bacterium]